jgi:Icc-related predicted phosphoesterase
MIVLAISDLHGQMERLEKLGNVIQQKRPDLVLFAGDFVKGEQRGNEWLDARREGRSPNREKEGLFREIERDAHMLEEVLDRFAGWDVPVAYVPGNMDSPKEHFLFLARNAESSHPLVRCVHRGAWLFRDRFAVMGFGGDISVDLNEDFFQFLTPRWEVEYQFKFAEELDQPLIFLFHIPPRIFCPEDDRSTGPEVVHELIKSYRPQLVVTGHLHDVQRWEKIGPSLVVSPGALKKGFYAIVGLPDQTVEFGKL